MTSYTFLPIFSFSIKLSMQMSGLIVTKCVIRQSLQLLKIIPISFNFYQELSPIVWIFN